MITINDIRMVVDANTPYDTGKMYIDGVRFIDNPSYYSIVYDGNIVPYIPYQEYGFIHYKSGKFIDVNRHFIQNDTVNSLNFLINNANGGQQDRINAFNKRTIQSRNSQMSQGVLDSIKGSDENGLK